LSFNGAVLACRGFTLPRPMKRVYEQSRAAVKTRLGEDYPVIAAKLRRAACFFRRAVCRSQTISLATHLDMVSSHIAVLEDTLEHGAGIAAFRKRKRGK
jgi:hypothetical protein